MCYTEFGLSVCHQGDKIMSNHKEVMDRRKKKKRDDIKMRRRQRVTTARDNKQKQTEKREGK